jgi:dihydrodipicolinate synthase/N-acetylneuraminate lyase
MTYTALFDYYTKVADKSPLPIILHNIPPVTFIDMPIELIIDLADHPNIGLVSFIFFHKLTRNYF